MRLPGYVLRFNKGCRLSNRAHRFGDRLGLIDQLEGIELTRKDHRAQDQRPENAKPAEGRSGLIGHVYSVETGGEESGGK